MNPHVSSVHSNGHAKVNWLGLPNDIVYNIADKFTRQRDLIHFGTVCHSWRSIYTDILKCRTRRLPLLMLATDLNQDDQTRSFYNISDNIVCNSQVHVPQNRHCPGSSHGWVATVTPDLKVSLINVFNRHDNEISLPPLQAFEQNIDIYHHPGFLRKIILSTNPASDPNYVILAIHGAASWLAYYKPGDKAWTSLDSKYRHIDDAIFYRDQFYVATMDGEVYAIDLDCIEPRVTAIAPATPTELYKRYLVDSSGDLLQIVRFTELGKRGQICDDTDDMTVSYRNDGFDVLKWDPIALEWIELTNLGDRVFFVGDNTSLCVSAAAYPKCLPNSIYYTDDYYEGYYDNEEYGIGPHDMGVFSFDDGRNRPHYPATSEIINPPPIWIEPPI